MTFLETRAKITETLASIGLNNVFFSKEKIPQSFPAAIVILRGLRGINRTHNNYASYEYDIEIFLIENVKNSDDPDSDIAELTMDFIEEYQKVRRLPPIGRVEYYPARAAAGREVMIAKLTTFDKEN